MPEVHLIDTTLRDGNQSLWACRMRTEAMLPTVQDLDSAGFDAMEFTVPAAQFTRAVRDLKEDPWDWLNLGTARARTTPLRLHAGVYSPFLHVPRSIQSLFLDKLAALGITTVRTSNFWNNFDVAAKPVAFMAEHGVTSVLNLIYSVSPRHTADYYARKTREAVALNPYRLCFKDVGGLLTPETAREMFPVVAQNAGDTPLEFHAHCSNGLAPYISLIAAEHGFTYIHTAVPPLADGSSLPNVFTMVSNLRARGFSVGVDTAPLERVSEHLFRVARTENLPVGQPLPYDERLYRHQIPGGMISNMRFQLGQLGLENRLDEALEEAEHVRADLGYPIMVTPLSQFVGSQAALNVVTKQRYATVTDDVIQYALGRYGEEAVTEMDPEIREKVLDRPRSRELAQQSVEEPSLEELRARFGSNISDEELITRVMTGVGAGNLELKRANPNVSYADYGGSEVSLVDVLRRALADAGVRRFEFGQGSKRVVVHR